MSSGSTRGDAHKGGTSTREAVQVKTQEATDKTSQNVQKISRKPQSDGQAPYPLQVVLIRSVSGRGALTRGVGSIS